jgi:hypothetical protein
VIFEGIVVRTVSVDAFDVVFVFAGSPFSPVTGVDVFAGVAGAGTFLSGPGRGILILSCAEISVVESDQKKLATMINRKLFRDRRLMRILL